MDKRKPKIKHGWKSSKRQDKRDRLYGILLEDLKKNRKTKAGVTNDE